MSNASFASLHAGLLARKGEARPSAEAMLANVLRRPVTAPAETQQSFVTSKPGVIASPSATAPAPIVRHEPVATPNLDDEFEPRPDYEVRLRDALAAWPAPKPEPALDQGAWVPESHFRSPTPARATLRLTQLQARALKLASLVLDRPQQDLLQAGLASQLEALACTDLANCACFKAAIAGLPNN